MWGLHLSPVKVKVTKLCHSVLVDVQDTQVHFFSGDNAAVCMHVLGIKSDSAGAES